MQQYTRNSKGGIKQARISLIKYTRQLLSQGTFTPIVIIQIIIETLQIISMSLVSPMPYQSIGIQQYRYISNILYPDYYLRTTNISTILTPIFFLFIICHLLIVMVVYYKIKNGQQTRLKIMVHYGFMFLNILLPPIFITSFSILVCDKEQSQYQSSFLQEECFSGFHGLLCFLAAFSSLYCISCYLYMSIFYFDPNPFYTHYYSTGNSLHFLGKLALKIGPPIFLIVDQKLNYNVLYIVMVAGLNLANFVVFRFLWPVIRNCKNLDHIVFRSEILSTFVLIIFIPLFFFYKLDPQNYLFLGSIFIGIYIGHQGLKYFQFEAMKISEMYLNHKIDSQQKQMYQLLVLYLISNQESIYCEDKIYIIDFLKPHQINCKNIDCLCNKIVDSCFQSSDQEQNKVFHYELVKMLIIELSTKAKNNFFMEIIQHYVQFYKLGQKNKTIYELSKKINVKLEQQQLVAAINIIQRHIQTNQFTPHQQKKTQDMLMLSDQKNDSLNERSFIFKYKLYSQRFLEFELMTILAAKTSRDYWQQIIQQDCETQKILRIARNIEIHKNNVNTFFHEKLLTIFQYHIETLAIYLKIMTVVFRVPKNQVQKEVERFQQIIKKNRDQDKRVQAQGVQFQQNSDIITFCAKQQEGILKFNKISKNIYELLCIHSSALMNRDMNTLLPSIFREFHTQKIQAYFQKSDEQIEQKNNKVHILNGKDQIITVSYLSKLFPCFQTGLELACFMKKQDDIKNCFDLMYYYETVCSRDKIQSSGDIIQIDVRLKQLLVGDDNSEQAFKTLNIAELIPQWCIYGECFTPSDDLYYENVILIQTTKISEEAEIKTLRVHTKQLQSITLQVSQIIGNQLQKKHRKNKNDKKNSYFIDKLAKKQKYNIQQAQEIKERIFINTSGYNNSILAVFIITFIIYAIFLILHEVFLERNFSSQSNSRNILCETSMLSSNIINIPILFKNNEIDLVAQAVDSSYSSISLIQNYINSQSLNNQIIIEMKLLEQEVKTASYTLKEGVLLYISKTRELINLYQQITNWQNIKTFYLINSRQVFGGITEIIKIDEQIINKIETIYMFQFILNIIKNVISFFLFCLVGLWIRGVIKLLEKTIQFYETKIETSKLQKYKNACDMFIFQVERKQHQRSIKNAQYIIEFACNLKEQTEKNLVCESQINNESQLLKQMRNKVKFQENSKFTPFFKTILCIFIFACFFEAIIFLQQNNSSSSDPKTVELIHQTQFLFSINQLIFINKFQPQGTSIQDIISASQSIWSEGIVSYQFHNKFEANPILEAFTQYRIQSFTELSHNGQTLQLFKNLQKIQKLITGSMKQEGMALSDFIEMRKKQTQQILVMKIISCIGIIILLYFLVVGSGKTMLQGIVSMNNLAQPTQS